MLRVNAIIWEKTKAYLPVGIFGEIGHEEFKHEFNNDCVLMQYTGLEDKNGKESYEGDIVSFGEGRNFKVVWAEKYGSWYVVPLGEYENNAPLGKSEKACEVIGNIYENPEMITKSNL